MHYSHLFTNIPGFIVSVFFILIGLAVLILKKPIIFSYRWFLLLFAILFLRPGINSFIIPYPIDMMTFVFQLFMLAFLFYLYFIMKGVMVLGADGDDFQKAFISVLTEGNYKFEQTFTSIKIEEPNLEISIAFQSWIGSGQIRMRNKENKETFNNIIAQLKLKEIKTNLIMPIFYIAIGTLLLVMELNL